jgi:hypothetical protein
MDKFFKVIFVIVLQHLFAGFVIAQNSSAEIPDLTFKGISFGISVSSFKNEMPGTTCTNPMDDRTHCEGRISFFDQPSEYSATFSNQGLTMVIVRIYSSKFSIKPEEILQHEEAVFQQATKQLLERFRVPEQFRKSFAFWRFGNQKEQGVILMRCDGKEKCIVEQEPGIQVILANERFNGRKKDF